MRKLLQILTIVLLVLSIVALGLGTILFGKRELLKGRTQALEKGLVGIAALLETPTDAEQKPSAFPEKDIADVTPQPVPEPERANFWTNYPAYLEDADKPLLKVRREDLMAYYKQDPISGKPLKDATTGLMITEGDGTMDAAIKKIAAAATYELDRLNNTRHQLRALREELVKTIDEYNDGKQRQRQSLAQISDQKNQIAGLEDEKQQLTGQVSSLEGEKKSLEDDNAAKDKQIETMTQDAKDLNDTIASQRKQIIDLKAGQASAGGSAVPNLNTGIIKMEAGRKGRVVSVNQDWSYVVLQLDDKAVQEIADMRAAMAAANTPGFPSVELFLKRGDSYVSKVRLVQIKPDQKLAIADVLVDWQQMPVEAGDIAFF